MNKFSILQQEKECYICRTTSNLHLHHIIEGTGRRKLSDEDGLVVYLCAKHHNLSNAGVHFNKQLDLTLKKKAQIKWMQFYNKNEEQWIARYRRNYL